MKSMGTNSIRRSWTACGYSLVQNWIDIDQNGTRKNEEIADSTSLLDDTRKIL